MFFMHDAINRPAPNYEIAMAKYHLNELKLGDTCMPVTICTVGTVNDAIMFPCMMPLID